MVGVGRLGRLHAQTLGRLSQVTLVGVYDLHPENARLVAEQCQTVAFPDLESLLNAVQAVHVVVPTVAHFEVAKRALEGGRHVFLEKPIAASLEQADQLIRLAQQNRCTLQIGHIERFNPAFRALRDVDLQPMFIESHRLSPFDPRGTDVAVVLDLMIHDLDLILSLVRSPVRGIEANGVAVLSGQVDIANARLQFENGCVANITASRISLKKMRKMRFFQQNAYISADFLEGVTEVFRLTRRPDATGAESPAISHERLPCPPGDPLELELRSFVEAVATGGRPPVSAEDGRRALEVALAIHEKIREQGIATL